MKCCRRGACCGYDGCFHVGCCPGRPRKSKISREQLMRLLFKEMDEDNSIRVDQVYMVGSELKDKQDTENMRLPRQIGCWLWALVVFMLLVTLAMVVFQAAEHDFYDDEVIEFNHKWANLLRKSVPIADELPEILQALESTNPELFQKVDAVYKEWIEEPADPAMQGVYINEGVQTACVGTYSFQNPWDSKGSWFYAFMTATYMGYGAFDVQTHAGRAWVMVFSIPFLISLGWLLRRSFLFFKLNCSGRCGCVTSCCSDDTTFIRRRLLFIIFVVCIYVAIAGLMYFIHFGGPGFDYVNGLYLAWTTIFSIGFGDWSPTLKQPGGYKEIDAWFGVWIFVGVIFVAFIAMVLDTYVEWIEEPKGVPIYSIRSYLDDEVDLQRIEDDTRDSVLSLSKSSSGSSSASSSVSESRSRYSIEDEYEGADWTKVRELPTAITTEATEDL